MNAVKVITNWLIIMNSLKTLMIINSMLTNHCSVSVESASSGVCGGAGGALLQREFSSLSF